jgi:small conductance mechanosensitive channel
MDFSKALQIMLQTIENMANGFIADLPVFVLAVITFTLFYFVAKRTRTIVIGLTNRRRKAKNLGLILGKLAQSAVIAAGLLVTLTILFPSFRPGDLIQLLGIGSVAIGFAFHDLFQNFLAGLLLLLTAPFHIGDQIIVQEYEGTVEDIAMRATTIKTYDGRRIVIPNTDLFTNSVTVNTAFEKRRLEYEISIGYEDDIDKAKHIIIEALPTIEGILREPPPEALVTALTDSGVVIRVYWWTKQHSNAHVLHQQDRVLSMLKERLIAEGITLYPTQQILVQSSSNGHNETLSKGRDVSISETS